MPQPRHSRGSSPVGSPERVGHHPRLARGPVSLLRRVHANEGSPRRDPSTMTGPEPRSDLRRGETSVAGARRVIAVALAALGAVGLAQSAPAMACAHSSYAYAGVSSTGVGAGIGASVSTLA